MRSVLVSLLPRAALLALAVALAGLGAGCTLEAGPASAPAEAQEDPVDQAQLRQALAAVRPQRPGVTDLYVVGFAGDASDAVFRNETLYLRELFERRFDARGRVVTLVNHTDNLGEHPYAPLATYDNLYDTLVALGGRMDRREDVLLLFLTSHGTEDATLYVQVGPGEEDYISPDDLRRALDASGIRNRVVVLSACYSGGFIPALRSAGTLVLTAARADRPSFGCGNTSNATYFGQAWLVDAMNRTADMAEAFRMAKLAIGERERREGEPPSLPQISQGRRIGEALARWRHGVVPGPAVPYPYPAVTADTEAAASVEGGTASQPGPAVNAAAAAARAVPPEN